MAGTRAATEVPRYPLGAAGHSNTGNRLAFLKVRKALVRFITAPSMIHSSVVLESTYIINDMSDVGAGALPPAYIWFSAGSNDRRGRLDLCSAARAHFQHTCVCLSLGEPAGTELLEATREEASGAWRYAYENQCMGTRLDAVKKALQQAHKQAATMLRQSD